MSSIKNLMPGDAVAYRGIVTKVQLVDEGHKVTFTNGSDEIYGYNARITVTPGLGWIGKLIEDES